MKELLIELDACETARKWAGDKSWPEIFATCHRGDWLLWLFYHTGGDKRLLTLAKGHCANTVRHLMKDERSVKAVDTAIAYGNGLATQEELDVAHAAAAYAAADAYAAAARKQNQQLTADICRKYLPIEVWNITEDGKLKIQLP